MDAMALYEATRGVWVLGSRREEAIYAFAVYKKKILEVYRIDRWFPSGTTEYQTRIQTSLINHDGNLSGK